MRKVDRKNYVPDTGYAYDDSPQYALVQSGVR